jgi:hypothetical protein
MPSHHQAASDWNPERLTNWARNLGEYVEAVITHILTQRGHPEQAYKACLGILNLTRKAGIDKQRLNKACQRAVEFQYYSYKGIERILKNKTEEQQLDCFQPLPEHPNIRGNNYYQTEGGLNDDQ